MDIKTLKNKIETNTLDDAPLILKYQDNYFLCNQYIDAICKNKSLSKLAINSVNDITTDSDELFDSIEAIKYLYVYNVEKLEENITPDILNLVVVCKETPSSLDVDYINIPKLINWQIEDFVKMRLPGLSSNQIKWLCEVAKYDIFRINQECRKIEIFPDNLQKSIFDQINLENGYCDLNSFSIFNFTNAIVKKDLATITAVLSDIKWIDIEAVGLITILNNQFKNILDIQFNPNATAENLGIKPSQYNAIKYNIGKFTTNQLLKIYQFITDLDYKLKSGKLQFKANTVENNLKFIEYITTTIISI